ncbi:MAG: PD40 domain-containing protein, partial [Chitinophagaceae bacterium]|nr:PD40 domain-containing protein [Anaerolineae bacterium]
EMVLELDPYNEQAQKALDKMEDSARSRATNEEEVVPGITQRQVLVFGGGTALFVLIIAVIVFAIVSSSSTRRSNQSATETAVIEIPTRLAQESTLAAVQSAETAVAQTQTQIALVSPTPTEPSTILPRFTLPPSFTPETRGVAVTPTPLAPPSANIPGRILGWSGIDVRNIDVLPMYSYPVAGGVPERIGGDNLEGRYPFLFMNNERVIYTNYYTVPSTYYGIQSNNLDGLDPRDNSIAWTTLADAFNDPDQANVSFDQTKLVFVAEAVNTGRTEVFLVDLTNPDTANAVESSTGSAAAGVTRITNDSGDYTYPVISPDGQKVVVIRNATEGAVSGVDIVIIDVTDRTITPLTTDGNTVIETMPRWSIDGRSIVYAAATADNRNSHDIYVVASDGSGLSFVLVSDPADEIYPVYSPDGAYLAFSSNRASSYDIYILEIASSALSQLTTTAREDDYPSVWVP